MTERKQTVPAFTSQPGPRRKLLKLRPETLTILNQVAAYRNEKMIDCVHNLLLEVLRRNASEMKAWIDRLANLSELHGKPQDDAGILAVNDSNFPRRM
ncbi:MAG TPA: hypothetical protein VN688_03740 [Gemmataceae bacterium]|nr:hypothetical protein [Gemmataceae bacterium]